MVVFDVDFSQVVQIIRFCVGPCMFLALVTAYSKIRRVQSHVRLKVVESFNIPRIKWPQHSAMGNFANSMHEHVDLSQADGIILHLFCRE